MNKFKERILYRRMIRKYKKILLKLVKEDILKDKFNQFLLKTIKETSSLYSEYYKNNINVIAEDPSITYKDENLLSREDSSKMASELASYLIEKGVNQESYKEKLFNLLKEYLESWWD